MRPAEAPLNQLSLEYTFAELQVATRNFDNSLRLGHGSFGGVYRGIQKDGTEVAVKVLDVPEEGGFEEEVRVLSRFRHPNLVILMGFARNASQRFLVYELLGGGDVYKRLQKSCLDLQPFSWRHRVSAALDAACGLSHLHNSTPKVFHRDIKSPNILLDRNGTAKMADFGLACLSHSTEHRVKQASGTVGYACPLYVQRGIVTEGSEVYSFGIVILEMLTASPPAYVSVGADGAQQYQFLVSHIQGDVRAIVAMADARARWPQQVSSSLGELALRCTQLSEELRPVFTDVVNQLRSLRDAPEGGPPPAVVPAATVMVSTQAGAARVGVNRLGAATPMSPAVPLANCTPGVMAPSLLSEQVHSSCRVDSAPGNYWERAQVQCAGNPFAPFRVLPGRAPAAAAQPQPQPPAAPVLWSLECVQAEGVDLAMLRREKRTLVHRQEAGNYLRSTLRVGRLFQEDFFSTLVPEEEARSAVSREHFQIWIDEVSLSEQIGGGGAAPSSPGTSCSIFLTNYSSNGTVVNGSHLAAPGEQSPLRHGDSVRLVRTTTTASDALVMVPFMEFRFDLAGSILDDGSACTEESIVSQVAELPGNGALTPHMSFSPANAPEPFFTLEVGGTAVRNSVAPANRRIVHGPLTGSDPSSCPPLVLGRAHQADFWQRLLVDEAFGALSRQHLEIAMAQELDAKGLTFHVRSLSDRSPIRVSASLENGAVEAAAPLPKNQWHPLQSGDVIIVSANTGSTLWLVFRDLITYKPYSKLVAPLLEEAVMPRVVSVME